MIKLIITYNDGKIIELNDLKDENAKHFFDCLSKSEFYWDNVRHRGFWTDIRQIRHIQAEKHTAQQERSENVGKKKKASKIKLPNKEGKQEDKQTSDPKTEVGEESKEPTIDEFLGKGD